MELMGRALPLASLLALAAVHGLATARPADAALSRAVELPVAGGRLHGTLTVPRQFDCPPLVVMLSGSGPTDRDGNSALLPGPNDSLKMLAAALAQAGVASLRYDKRGVAHSRAALRDERLLRPETHAADAAAWLRQVRRERRFASLTILGHSEGALAGMLAARMAGADAFISLAGPAEPAAVLLRRQWMPNLPPDLARATGRMLAALERGRPQVPVRPELKAVFRPSVQPYMVAWFRYVPAREFARLRMPALVVQGTSDMQVGLDQAWLLKRARPGAEMALVAGMNHMLKTAPADPVRQLASYTDPSWPLAPSLVEAVAGFVRTAPPRRACAVSGVSFAAAPG